jgi:hypothetical protein
MCDRVMRNLAVVVIGLACGVAGSAAPKPKDPEPNIDALAKEAAEQFAKALNEEDLDAVMKVVDLPFGWDAVKTVKDREGLKEEFARVFREKDLTRFRFAVDEVKTYGDVAPKLSERRKKVLDEVLKNEDRVVFVKPVPAKSDDRTGIAVRIREGKVKVIGFFD